MKQEEKAKAYDEALERAKKWFNPEEPDSWTCIVESIFPELKENEDENLKEQVVYAINQLHVCECTKNKLIAWLEKQGEQKVSEYDVVKTIKERIIEHFDNHLIINKCFSIGGLKDDILKIINEVKFAKQGEQKPIIDGILTATNYNKMFQNCNVHKFNVGDWIVFNGLTLLVNEVVQGYYRTISIGGISNSYDWDIDNVARLWTIQDAKDGDVLVFKNNIGGIIICKSPTDYDTRSYCRLVSDNFINKEESGWDSTLLVPAIKEQHDILMKAMTDARYTFDFEKKELKKIECWNPKKGDTCQEKNTKRKIYLCDENGIGFNYIEISNVHLAGGYVSIAQLLQDYELVEPTEEESAEITYVKEFDKPINKRYLADFINGLSKQFPEVSFAKLSRIAVRVAKFVEQKMQQTK